MKQKIFKAIEESRALVVELETELTARRAVSPEAGGEGELEKADFLFNWLRNAGFSVLERHDAPDPRAKGGVRPNLIATLEGENRDAPRLWIMSHLDVVPPGDASLWKSDPWTAVCKDGRVIGRGVEDNQHGLCASLAAANALLTLGIQPYRTIKLLFVADEECGSLYGVDWLLKNRNLFLTSDFALVPDSGSSDGLSIEIAEKNMLWLRVNTKGVQAHGSTPHLGRNAHLAACDLALALHYGLCEKFNRKDPLFNPPASTFEITKKEANIPNINTIPAEDVFYMDMRILPCYKNREVFAEIDRIKSRIQEKHGVSIEYSVMQEGESMPTDAKSPFVKALSGRIEGLYGGPARIVGIGGGTAAAFLRNAGVDSAVWCRINETAHQPNEYTVIDDIIGDAKIMASLMIDEY
ncbi:MAG: M20 family metallo-hydrolase [Spirochaetaceae bacterium]|jgi:succinyl-diaminopimelate desuccinylase|nr:M20 family metallo-hydrolase [Spirochaetaceae bacterium]